MPDEEPIHKRILEAAKGHEPEFEEGAWEAMSRMLDKELPIQKKRRKLIPWIWALGFTTLGAGVLFVTRSHPANIHAKSTFTSQSVDLKPQNHPEAGQGLEGTVPKTNTGNRTNASKLLAGSGFNRISASKINGRVPNNLTVDPKRRLPAKTTSVLPAAEGLTIVNPVNVSQNKKDAEENSDATTPTNETVMESKQVGPESSDWKKGDQRKGVTPSNAAVPENSSLKQMVEEKRVDSNKVTVPDNKFLDRLSLELSLGPDVSAAGLGQPGKVTLMEGVSLSYKVGKRYFIRSGFLIASKIYSVDSGGYGSSQYNPGNTYLQSIGANCTVYEIPLTAGYYLSHSQNHSWFLDMGLSTYLMKKESYTYLYKYPSGVTDTKFYSVTNQNHHYFSVLDISAGYERSFNRHVGIAIEPYLKIPVTGIGVQRIKLNSAGLLFSLKFNGF